MPTLFNVRCYSNKAPIELMCRFLVTTGSAQQHIARVVFLGLIRGLPTNSLADGIGKVLTYKAPIVISKDGRVSPAKLFYRLPLKLQKLGRLFDA